MGSELKLRIEKLALRLEELAQTVSIEERKEELGQLEIRANQPDFWSQEKDPASLQQRVKELSALFDTFKSLRQEICYLNDILEVIDDNAPEAVQVLERAEKLEFVIEQKEIELCLSGKYDSYGAIFTVKSGAGGRDAEDWAAMMARMYQRYFERRGWNVSILLQQYSDGGGPEGRLGIKEIVWEVKGSYAYGLLAKEAGVHRLVRISPFSAKQLRHTSFASVDVLPRLREVDVSLLALNPDDLKVETFRSSGPGGQNVNKRESAVRITHLPTGIQASSQIERSQPANKKIAWKVLTAKLIQLEEQKREKELDKFKKKSLSVSFGSQIRSYVLYPYKLIKDHRTGIESVNIEAILDGDLDNFIRAGIKY